MRWCLLVCECDTETGVLRRCGVLCIAVIGSGKQKHGPDFSRSVKGSRRYFRGVEKLFKIFP